jgi:pimeloyl-ACP methyl ester carboxylesterase
MTGGETGETPIVLRGWGSFVIGGGHATVQGKALRTGTLPWQRDPNGTYPVGHIYVQYALPATADARPPIVFWHGGAMTGSAWETTPDGRPGWFDRFVRCGYDCYVLDGVERGRAGWAMVPDIWPDTAEFVSRESAYSHARWRIGRADAAPPAPGAVPDLPPGSRFPAACFDQFVRRFVPRWRHNGAATVAAVAELLDRIGPAVLITHSESGPLAFGLIASKPARVAAHVALEPSAAGTATVGADAPPTLGVWGDRIEGHQRLAPVRAAVVQFFAAHRAAGARADILDLPARGIHGNSHFLMLEDNSDEVAGLIAAWLDDVLPARRTGYREGGAGPNTSL